MIEIIAIVVLAVVAIALLAYAVVLHSRRERQRKIEWVRERDRTGIMTRGLPSTFSTPPGAEAQREAWTQQYLDDYRRSKAGPAPYVDETQPAVTWTDNDRAAFRREVADAIARYGPYPGDNDHGARHT